VYESHLSSNEVTAILDVVEALPTSDINHENLRPMDILEWRSAKGGHMAFYLGEGQNGQAIIGDSNRSDDKTIEGTCISERHLSKDGYHTYAFRMKEKRK
jgi:hypothetical protein